jgi:hypothetical protein
MANVDQLIEALTQRLRDNAEHGAPRVTKPAKFTTTMNFTLWLQSFNAYCEAVGIEEDNRRPHLLGLLDLNTAYAAVDKMELDEDLPYDEFADRLVERFSLHRTVQDYRFELSTREQSDKETVETYADDLLELARHAFPNADAELRSELAKEKFLKGVRVADSVRERLYLAQPNNLTDAIRTVRQLEAALRASQARTAPRGRMSLNAVETAAVGDTREEELRQLRKKVKEMEDKLRKLEVTPGDSRKRDGQHQEAPTAPRRCYLCNETGHFARNCPSADTGRQGASRVKCYNCGLFGHLSLHCPQGNGGRGSRI